MNDRILTIKDDESNELQVFVNSNGKIALVININRNEGGELIELTEDDTKELIKDLKKLVKYIP